MKTNLLIQIIADEYGDDHLPEWLIDLFIRSLKLNSKLTPMKTDKYHQIENLMLRTLDTLKKEIKSLREIKPIKNE